MDLEAVATAVGVIVSFGTAVAALVVGHLHERERQREQAEDRTERQRERAEDRKERQRERAEDRAERQREQAKGALYSLNAFAVNTSGPKSKLLGAGEYKRYIDETYYGWGVAARELDQLRITLGRPDIAQLVEKALQLMTKQFHLVKAAVERDMQRAGDDPQHLANLDPGGLWLQAGEVSRQLTAVHTDLFAAVGQTTPQDQVTA